MKAVFLTFLCLAVAASSTATAKTGNAPVDSGPTVPAAPNASSNATPQNSPTSEPEPLKMPERVASGAESGGGWNDAVDRIAYFSSADDTRRPVMFYKPPTDLAAYRGTIRGIDG